MDRITCVLMMAALIIHDASGSSCIELAEITDYDLKLTTTVRGYTCQRWESQTPHVHLYTNPAMFPDDPTLTDAANYCRTPDSGPIPWCYVAGNFDVIWDYCSKPKVACEGNCRAKAVGWDYIGNTNKTLGGYTCQRWDSQIPHWNMFMDISKSPDDTFADTANYCRNPDYYTWPWCFTTDPARRWELCPTYELSCATLYVGRVTNFTINMTLQPIENVRKSVLTVLPTRSEGECAMHCLNAPACNGIDYDNNFKICHIMTVV